MWWLRASRPRGRVGAAWPALLGKVSFVCVLTEDLQSILTAHLGRTFCIRRYFWKLFHLGRMFWTGGGGLSVFFPACPSGPREGPPCLDVGAGLSGLFCERQGLKLVSSPLLHLGNHRNNAYVPCYTAMSHLSLA